MNAWIQFSKPSRWSDKEHGAEVPKEFCDVSGLLFPARYVANWIQHGREAGHEHLQSTVSDLVNLPAAFGKMVLSFMYTRSFSFEEASLDLASQELNWNRNAG